MKQDDFPFKIAITGGIGSGKTSAAEWFAKKGYRVHYADRIGHKFFLNDEIRKELITNFGKVILAEDNSIDRRKLGEIIFKSNENRKTLNKILHPLIIKEIEKIIKESKERILVFEIPLLFETGMEKLFDLTINIIASKENKLSRLLERDGLSQEEIRERINAQLEESLRKEKADINIFNNGSIENLYETLLKLEILIKAHCRQSVTDINFH